MKLNFGGIHERDIDLLVFLELAGCEQFLRWFVAVATGTTPVSAKTLELTRSAITTTGECDLLLVVDTGMGAPDRLLIENKIDASFQPMQAARYADRAERDRLSRKWHSVTTVLLAPADYCDDDDHGFDKFVSYEQVRAHLARTNGHGARTDVVVALLDQAIEKAKLGYSASADSCVTEYWRRYWELCSREFPDLHPPAPTGRPSRSGFVYFQQPLLPPTLKLIHKLPHGFVDLQVPGQTAAALHRQLADRFDPRMSAQQRSKSAAIAIAVPPCDTGRPFDEQIEAVRAAASAAKLLLKWFDRHQSAVCSLL